MLTRKTFLRQTLLASAGVAWMGWNYRNDPGNHPAGQISFDFHAHPGAFHQRGLDSYAGEGMLSKTVAEMNQARLSGAFFSMVVDMLVNKVTPTGVVPAREFDKGEAWREYKRQLGQLKVMCKELGLRHATRSGDLKADAKAVAVFFACEGGDFLESADQLDEVYKDGVRSIQLVHYAPNPLGDLQTYQPQHAGLSALGKQVVKRMNALGMVIDVAHASYETVKQTAEASSAPIILSHSILKVEADRPIAIRAITADHARLVANTGGVIGAWPSGFSTSFDDYVDNIMRLVDVVGVNHVALGTDMDSNFRPVLDSYLQLTTLRDALVSRGLSTSEAQKIMGGNAVRVLENCLKG